MTALLDDQEEMRGFEERRLEGRSTGALREAVVTEAKTWIGTPFHHAARIKGAGVDCLMLLSRVSLSVQRIEHSLFVKVYDGLVDAPVEIIG